MSRVVLSPCDRRHAAISMFQEVQVSNAWPANRLKAKGCLAALVLAEAPGRRAGTPTRSGILQALHGTDQANPRGSNVDL
ncbi:MULTISPECIES: hypothetical protein [unclassified Variovorax]|uniref:hypothetical protein n=1 Tax=unclassified Variovorax TaxID=663243 RepID=UPI00117D549B|nr:hypothetical protein [Variovorax sp. YR752]